MNDIASKHKHEWREENNSLVCSCGKRKLKLIPIPDTDMFEGTRADGSKYIVRGNRDRIFYPEEWNKFFECLRIQQTFTFKFLALTGSRIMEAQHVKVEDIDFANQRVVFKVTKQRGGDNIRNKSKTRTIRVSRELIKDIRKLINDENLKKEDYLGILSTSAANTAMFNALVKANIKDAEMFSIQSVRKTSENWALSIGVDSMRLSTRFGHNMNTQYEHYSQSDSFNPKEKEWIKQFYGDTFIE